MLTIPQRQPLPIDFQYLSLSPAESGFVAPFRDQLLDENDPVVLIWKPFAEEEAQRSSESLRQAFPNQTIRVFPSYDIKTDFYVCMERHLIPGVSRVSQRVRAASKPLTVSILEHNARLVEDGIETKLKNEFEDAQHHIDSGYQPAWARYDSLLTHHKGVKKPFGNGRQKVPELSAGVAWAQGENKHMEDVHLVTCIKVIEGNKEVNIPLYAIFDGHCNFWCASYLKKNLPGYLQDKLQEIFAAHPCPGPKKTAKIFNLLKLAFVELGRRFNQALPCESRYMSGSTATIALILDGYLWVANVGDSRAILCKEGKAIALSQDAKPGLSKYVRGIEKRGRYVGFANGCLRTIGSRIPMGVARAVGHDELESGINPRAEIIRYPLSEIDENSTLVVASDGLWDAASANQVAETVEACEKSKKDCHRTADHLVTRAYYTGSDDNISVVVVKFKS